MRATARPASRPRGAPPRRNRVAVERDLAVPMSDGIVRLTAADPLTGTVPVSLAGAAHRFGRGHRIRLQVAGGAHPRFARNPGNGRLDAGPAGLVPTRYEIGLDAARPSCLFLPAGQAWK